MNGLPPTPAVWQEARAADGRVYYYNAHTKATQWTKPMEMMTPQERAIASQPWREFTTPDGRKYWNNTETKKSVWEIPEAYKNAISQSEPPARPPAQHPVFVAGGTSSLTSYTPQRDPDDYPTSERKESDRFSGANGIPVTSTGEQAPAYSSFEEAEAAFLKLLRRSNVPPGWTWEQTMRATIKDPQYRALKDPKDRKAAFEKYVVEVRLQEKERAKDRLAKLRADFGTMLRSHPEIKHYSRWKTIRPIIEGETIFRSTDDEDERRQLFEEYIVELKKANVENEAALRKSAMAELVEILKALDLEPYTRWAEAQGIIESNERFHSDHKFRALSKSDLLTAFENHIKSLERAFNDARQQQKNTKARRERQNRDRMINLLNELRSQGKIKAGSKWMDVLVEIEDEPRYVAMLGQSGSTPLDLFWDMVEEGEKALRGRRNDVYDVLEDKRYEITQKTTFDEFADVMVTDRRAADIDRDALKLIFDRLYEKVLRRNEEERHAADRHQKRATDALRSRIKHLEPPVQSSDSWDMVRSRVAKTEEFRVLETDDVRKVAFDKVIKRLKEKEEDLDRVRERRRSRREEERDVRNGHSGRNEGRRGHASRTPEVDAYEADRRKAMADREKSYRKSNALGLSTPPSLSRRDRDRDRDRKDRDDRHGRLERSPPAAAAAASSSSRHYEGERRDREEERERLYRTRGDPRGGRDELNYGEESRSATGNERRRRRSGGSDGDSDGSAKRTSKRHRRETRDSRDRRRSRTPPEVKKAAAAPPPAAAATAAAAAPPPPEPAGVHSGSEEGEIEED